MLSAVFLFHMVVGFIYDCFKDVNIHIIKLIYIKATLAGLVFARFFQKGILPGKTCKFI